MNGAKRREPSRLSPPSGAIVLREETGIGQAAPWRSPRPERIIEAPFLADDHPVSVMTAAAMIERRRLLALVEQDRVELIELARRLRGPAHALARAQRAAAAAGSALRWVRQFGRLSLLSAYLRIRRQPLLLILLVASVGLYGAWSKRLPKGPG